MTEWGVDTARSLAATHGAEVEDQLTAGILDQMTEEQTADYGRGPIHELFSKILRARNTQIDAVVIRAALMLRETPEDQPLFIAHPWIRFEEDVLAGRTVVSPVPTIHQDRDHALKIAGAGGTVYKVP